MKNLKIGWVGLGNMGNVMAANILKAGYELQVFNRSRGKEDELVSAGAVSAAGLEELARDCDIVFTMLADDNAVKSVYEDGLLSGIGQGKLLIDMSTVAPATSVYLAGLCQSHAVSFLDAPVSGSVQPATEGTLIIMVGGESEDYQQALPLFEVLGKLSLHLGGHGAGSSAKVAINYLLAVQTQALAETVLFAQRNGIDKERMLQIVNEGACGNKMSQLKTPSIIKGEFPAAFALKYIVKDLKLAKQAGLDAPLANPVLDTFSAAMQSGLGNEDLMAVVKYLDNKK
ncbi:3-hydroxyisobutyrate dehydrogenase [Pedobacter antarcticus]|uniref:3-hydroxyisobutyrate dehydrogenase n=1 Tax=Pedobacter antarcticus TaxID=34086 RepID=A0A1I1ZQR4_9SPHI|nr:NAD(P)-dependent oxidoreductase [Pedobacter antarcticus]SFE32933.1 3-hydroxyisobutyrate dehydrogenase [Pedobacter antarcticus]